MRRVLLTDTDDIELETTLQELALNLRRDAVETNMAVRGNGRTGNGGHLVGLYRYVEREEDVVSK